jgi:hypothetical protein
MMMKKILLISLVTIVFGACRPEPEGLDLLDELVVKTTVSPDADFSDYESYAIATDTIGFFTNVDADDTLRIYSNDFPYPRLVLNAVNENLRDKFGKSFERKAIHENPDLGVNVYVVNGLSIYQQVIIPSYNYYYYGYYGYYYDAYVATHVDNRATLIVEIVDLKNQGTNGEVRVLWSAFMGDVISSVDYTQQSIDAIHEAFEQSPYIFQP